MPTGGVIPPTTIDIATTTANWSGSSPAPTAIGWITGTSTIAAARESITQPRMISTTQQTTVIRIGVGSPERNDSRAPGTSVKPSIHAKMLAVETIISTTPEVIAASCSTSSSARTVIVRYTNAHTSRM